MLNVALRVLINVYNSNLIIADDRIMEKARPEHVSGSKFDFSCGICGFKMLVICPFSVTNLK